MTLTEYHFLLKMLKGQHFFEYSETPFIPKASVITNPLKSSSFISIFSTMFFYNVEAFFLSPEKGHSDVQSSLMIIHFRLIF